MSQPTSGWSLRTDQDFFKQAHRRGSHYFTFYSLPYSSFEFVIIVPKGVAPLATERNKLKRRCKAIAAKLHKANPALSGKVVVSARRSATQATFGELAADLSKVINHL